MTLVAHASTRAHRGTMTANANQTYLDQPDTIVRTGFLTFMLLACGRMDPEPPLAAGTVQLEGNRELAGQLARGLRFII